MGDGEYYLDSPFSSVFSYAQPQRLETPTTSSVNLKTRLVSWTAVEGAASYQVLIERADYSSSHTATGTTFSLNFMQTTGEFIVKVKAISGTDEKRDSVYTNGFDLILGYELGTPTRVSYTPAISLITWSSVPHADAYVLLIGGEEYRSGTTSFDLREAGAPATYTVYVRAVSDSIIYFDSNYSNGVQCKLVVTLATPTNIRVDEDQSAIVWDASPYVNHYSVYVSFGAVEDSDIKVFSTHEEKLSLSNLKKTGDYVISVQACGNGDGTTKNSQTSEETRFYLIALLEKPWSTSLNYLSKLYSFRAVENAVGYVVNLDGTDYQVGNNLSFDLSGVESGEHTIKYKALADGVNYKDSEYSTEQKFSFQ